MSYSLPPPKTFLIELLKTSYIGAFVLGIGGRSWMFLVALVLSGNVGFSYGGTFEVVLFGALVGFFSGLVYLLLIKGRFKRPAFEAAAIGIGAYLVLSFLPIDGKDAIMAYDERFWFPILLGFALLFYFFGVVVVRFSAQDT